MTAEMEDGMTTAFHAVFSYTGYQDLYREVGTAVQMGPLRHVFRSRTGLQVSAQ